MRRGLGDYPNWPTSNHVNTAVIVTLGVIGSISDLTDTSLRGRGDTVYGGMTFEGD